MSFPYKQKYKPAMSYPIQELELVTLESGEVVNRLVDQAKVLPDPELFELKNVLAAGVQPEEVQTKIMRSTSVNADNVVRKYTRKTKNKEEVTSNENE